MVRGLVVGVLAAAALAVTATVTMADGGTVLGAYAPVITNLNTGKQMRYRGADFPDRAACETAIKGLPEFLRWFADGNDAPGQVVPEAVDADPMIKTQTEGLAIQLYMSTGVIPNLGMTCELPGNPA